MLNSSFFPAIQEEITYYESGIVITPLVLV